MDKIYHVFLSKFESLFLRVFFYYLKIQIICLKDIKYVCNQKETYEQ